MTKHLITLELIVKEALRIIGRGRIGAVSMYDIYTDRLMVRLNYGERTDSLQIPCNDLLLSLNAFKDKWLTNLPDKAAFETPTEKFLQLTAGADSAYVGELH
jgi:hypothetical protein